MRAPIPDRLTSARQHWTSISYNHLTIFQRDPIAFGIYTYLSIRAGNNESTWPSIRCMHHELHLSTTTIQKKLDVLIEMGVLTVIPGDWQTPNRYTLYDPVQTFSFWDPQGPAVAVPPPSPSVSPNATPTIPAIIRGVSPDATGVSPDATELDSPVRSNEDSPSTHVLAAAKPQRQQSEIQMQCQALWASMERAFGYAPASGTSSAGAWNKAVQQLRLEGATPEDVPRMCARWPSFYDKATLTPTALGSHAAELLRGTPLRASPASTQGQMGEDAIAARAREIAAMRHPEERTYIEVQYRPGGD
jgi:hypothetical protein